MLFGRRYRHEPSLLDRLQRPTENSEHSHEHVCLNDEQVRRRQRTAQIQHDRRKTECVKMRHRLREQARTQQLWLAYQHRTITRLQAAFRGQRDRAILARGSTPQAEGQAKAKLEEQAALERAALEQAALERAEAELLTAERLTAERLTSKRSTAEPSKPVQVMSIRHATRSASTSASVLSAQRLAAGKPRAPVATRHTPGTVTIQMSAVAVVTLQLDASGRFVQDATVRVCDWPEPLSCRPKCIDPCEPPCPGVIVLVQR